MPISSGAAGRVDASVTWTPDGGRKEASPVSRSGDSYLRRYLETQQLVKTRHGATVAGEDSRQQGDQEGGTRDGETPQTHGESDGDSPGKPKGREDGSNKSKTCTLL